MKCVSNGTRIVPLLLLLLLITASGYAQNETRRFQHAYESIDEFAGEHMRQAGTPGMAIAVTSRDSLLRVSTYGFADLESKVSVSPECLFQIGSISKSFTAIALLQMREKGNFDPLAPVTAYLPWFKLSSGHGPITAHHLLSHTSGLPRDRDDIPSSLFSAVAVRERELGFIPGTRFSYSNVGYQILGYLLERIAGRAYGEIIRTQILEPLGMIRSEPVITHETRKRMAVAYVRLYDDRPPHSSMQLVRANWFEYGAGDGSITATPQDLASYIRMLLNRGRCPQGRILSEESFSLLTQRILPDSTSEGETWYGYGLQVQRVKGHTQISHSGSMVGYSSRIIGDLHDGLGVCVFMNGPGKPDVVASFALKTMQAELKGEKVPAVPETETPARVANAVDYKGIYLDAKGKRLKIVAKGEALSLIHQNQQILLERIHKDRFVVNHPNFTLFPLQFERNDSGIVTEVAYGPDWYVNERYNGLHDFDYPPEWESYTGHYRTSNPWLNNFRIIIRKGKLYLVLSQSPREVELIEIKPGVFRIGTEPSGERLSFDTVLNNRALRSNYSGVDFFRTFTP